MAHRIQVLQAFIEASRSWLHKYKSIQTLSHSGETDTLLVARSFQLFLMNTSPCCAIAVLFTVARTWKKPKCLSIDEWIIEV